jgi:N-acyl-D-aspartate/D-glutamate deacylase
MRWIEQCNADGLEVRGQVSGRPTGLLMGFELSRNPFYMTPTFLALKKLPQAERLRALRQPDVRARLVSETPGVDESPGASLARQWTAMYPLGEHPVYEPTPDMNVAAQAARLGVSPEDLVYDIMLAQDGQGVLFVPVTNFPGGTLDLPGEMLRHPNSVYGLGDGGAHLGFLCDASLPTYMLQYWARERTTGRIPVAEVVRGLSHDTARAVGLRDRGLLRAGYRADINVIDFDRLELGPPRAALDLPAGGTRVTQGARGYAATIVGGIVTYRDGIATGALPGRLVRGARDAAA